MHFQNMIQRLKKEIRSWYHWFPVIPFLTTRDTHLFCIGTAKSGTTSLHSMFKGYLRSNHEADSHEVIDIILKIEAGKISEKELQKYIEDRDKRLRLEIDSSQLNYFLLDQLVEMYPDAKFILTIRNPFAWVDSFINHQLGRNASEKWKRFRDFRFRPDHFEHPPEEDALAERGLYTLDGYFSYWSRHNIDVLEKVPASRLMVVRTTEITEKAREIAGFAGVSHGRVNKKRSHSNKATDKYNVLAQIDREYLTSKVEQHCDSLMRDYFPDILCPKEGLTSLPESDSF